MTCGIIVLCRFDSRRLPGKILRPLGGKPALDYILERLERVRPVSPVVVATSDEASDDPIADHCAGRGVDCFRGSKDDVAGRIHACAARFGFEYFVRICGDNILLDPALVGRMIVQAVEGGYDLVSNLPGRTFPPGISVEVLRREFYAVALPAMTDPQDREHVTRLFYRDPPAGMKALWVRDEDDRGAARIKLALDDAADADFLESLIARLTRDHREYHLPELRELARHCPRKEPVSHA